MTRFNIMATAIFLCFSAQLQATRPATLEEKKVAEEKAKQDKGISFRDYYRANKAKVDKRVAERALHLSNTKLNDLTDFDEENVPGLNRITILSLSFNRLTALPPDIFKNFTSLTWLVLRENHITALPAGIFDGLDSLVTLEVDGNQIRSLPAGIFDNLKRLRKLYLHDNQISELPAHIFDNLVALEELRLDGNEINTIPANIFAALTALADLNLSDNRIRIVQPNMFNGLLALTGLKLSYNLIDTLSPNIFSNLTELKFIGLAGNKLTTLPATIFHALSHLSTIDLSNNQISKLPANIFNGLERLLRLDLADNQLSELPDKIFQGLSLDFLNLHNNPFPFSEEGLMGKYHLFMPHFYFKGRKEQILEDSLFRAIKSGDAAKAQERFNQIVAHRHPESTMSFGVSFRRTDISKIRDAHGNNLLHAIVDALAHKRAEILKEQELSAKFKGEQIKTVEQLYIRIFMILTQFGGPKVQDMLLTRNKAGNDVLQAAFLAFGKDSSFVKALFSYKHTPRRAGEHAPQFPIKNPRRLPAEQLPEANTEVESVEKGLAEQRRQLEPPASSALSNKK